MSKFVTIDPPPGLRGAGTDYQSKDQYLVGDLVRFWEDIVGPIGGWVQRSTVAMSGLVRAGISWIDSTTVRWQAWGSNTKLYAFSQTSTVPSDITPAGLITGAADAISAGGYGVGLYGAGTYGTPRTDVGSTQEAGIWELAIWGATGDLLACLVPSDGVIYRWQRDTGVIAAALGGTAPVNNQGIAVTPEGFLFALGAGGDARKVQWADQGSLATWTPSATNQAGSVQLQTQGTIKCGAALRTQTLIWTNDDCHAATYVGLPSVYRFDRVGEKCGIIGRGAYAVHGSNAFWASLNGFFVYDGGSVQKIPCDIWDDVYGDMNITQRSKFTAQYNGQFSELWFRWVSSSSTEIDRCCSVNVATGVWMLHPSLTRLAGFDRGVFTNPLMVDASGSVYDHETGYLYSGATPYITTGPMEIASGDRLVKVLEMIPDEQTRGDVQVTFYAKDSPNGTETTFGPYTMADFVNVRFAARQVKMKVSGVAATHWRWGNPRLNVIQGGRR